MNFVCLIKLKENDLHTLENCLSEQLKSIFNPDLALLHIPAVAEDKYTSDGISQHSIIEIHTNSLDAIESNLPQLKDALIAINVKSEPIVQVTLAREFSTHSSSSLKKMFSYFVEYSGNVENETAWANHYVKNHAEIMLRMPKIESVFVYTSLTWIYPEQIKRFESLLCNRVSFATQNDLEKALSSPVRDELREDYHSFPQFEGICTHHAMDTYIITT